MSFKCALDLYPAGKSRVFTPALRKVDFKLMSQAEGWRYYHSTNTRIELSLDEEEPDRAQ